ncbi:adenylate/guanylate cyclase domain-containing protein [Pseudomonas sp. WHRI 8822A]|uniref:adenylate/guanylate cyclase domain-containing protein n=1 Tax=Pseudomonas sp. WHRI 8822A TaxID=3162568 RepID=UPI0032EFF608
MNEIYGGFSLSQPVLRGFAQDSKTYGLSESMESAKVQVFKDNSDDSDFKIQNNIRALFGKIGHKPAAIGGHPDFAHLENNGRQEKGYVVSLFVDIKGSTKLGVVYNPEEVFWIKNQIIKCAIETVLAFDGHVHRIMGDAVLAFFRGNDISPRDSAINAINCGTYLVEFMRSVVSPRMKDFGVQDEIGIRVGVDYGPHESVLWAMYGYAGSSEVTATSYHVDVAAKLQQQANKNRVMVGQALVDLLDLHDDFIGVKESGGQLVKYVTPNYTNKDGRPRNYKQFVIRHEKYFDVLPKPEDRESPIAITSFVVEDDVALHKCSRSVGVSKHIKFMAEFQIPGWGEADVKVRFRVENHGAQAAVTEGFSNHSTEVPAVKGTDGRYRASNIEPTAYVGLHYMYVSVIDAEGKVFYAEQNFPVYIG